MPTLSQTMPGLYATWNVGTGRWDLGFSTKTGAWSQATPAVGATFPTFTPALIQRSTIDLSGWMQGDQDVTCFPIGFSIQEPGKWFNNSDVNKYLTTIEMISTVKFSDQELVDSMAFNSAPGMDQGPGDWDRITFGRWRLKSAVAAGPGAPSLENTLYTQDVALFGSGEPVAVDTLYFYRVIVPNVSDDGAIIVAPAARIIAEANFSQEKPLVHLDRMYRSYNSRT